MTNTWRGAVVLAALELTPGEPSDLTALLRDSDQRRALLDHLGAHAGARASSPATSQHDAEDRASALTPLASYLAAALDTSRVEHWFKILENGANQGAYAPVLVGDDNYPHRLAHVWDAPPVLFHSLPPTHTLHRRQTTHGVPVDPQTPSVAIVGGRDADEGVLAATYLVAAAVADAGIRVVSGLASGVDTAAHIGALSVGGLTTAVLGTGIGHVYPTENRQLAADVRRNGVLVSQFAPPAPRTGTTFLRRNAVIAGLSDVSLIMDGRARSGSRHEVDQAIGYERPVLLWAPALARERWATVMAESGWASYVESVDDVLAHLG